MSDAVNQRSHADGRAVARPASVGLAHDHSARVRHDRAAGLPDARGQETLRWKFREGDVLKYTTEQTTVDDRQGDGQGAETEASPGRRPTPGRSRAFPRPATPTSSSGSSD